MVAFAEEVSDAVEGVFNPDFQCGQEVSIDLAVTSYDRRPGVVLLPKAHFYAGGGGAAGRSGVAHDGGRCGDLRMCTSTKFSLLGTDQAASISGVFWGKEAQSHRRVRVTNAALWVFRVVLG